MFELSNEQRRCFGLAVVKESWDRIEVKQGPYDNFRTYLYLDDDVIVKAIAVGESQYFEYELFEKVSPDRKYLLPKTDRGKPVLLTASSIQKRKGSGMRLNYYEDDINLYHETRECSYYSNSYLNSDIQDINDFSRWVISWCEETTEEDILDVHLFSQKERKHVKYQEGDVFRFKIGRRMYGYGRILLDYAKMRKKKQPFWDIFMGKPLVCSVYHIVTACKDISMDELKGMKSLPSCIIFDNALYYGEYEIAGNIPISMNEDYPIMYGRSIDVRETAVCYQRGKVFHKIENGTLLYGGFMNHGVSFGLNFTLDVLVQCVKENSNAPYWSDYYPAWTKGDLRNPQNEEKLSVIIKQFEE